MAADQQRRQLIGEASLVGVALVGFVAIFIGANAFGREAAIFPKLVAVLGALCAALRLAQDGRALLAGASVEVGGEVPDGEGGVGWTDFLLSYIGPALYAAMLYVLGFWVASATGLMALFAVLGERRPPVMIGLTALTLGLIYVLFDLSFGIRMPGSAVFEFLGAR